MKTIMTALVALSLLAGCGYREGVTVAEPGAFLAFGGNTTGAIVRIDADISFPLGEGHGQTTASDSGEKETRLAGTHYRLSPGLHRIQVEKNGSIVVDRELMLGDGTTREILVP